MFYFWLLIRYPIYFFLFVNSNVINFLLNDFDNVDFFGMNSLFVNEFYVYYNVIIIFFFLLTESIVRVTGWLLLHTNNVPSIHSPAGIRGSFQISKCFPFLYACVYRLGAKKGDNKSWSDLLVKENDLKPRVITSINFQTR